MNGESIYIFKTLYSSMYESEKNYNKMLPYYLAITTQLIIQIFIVVSIIGLIINPIRYSGLLGIIFMGLIGLGVIMAYLTILISISYKNNIWMDFSDFQYRTCILSVIMGIIVGGFVLLSRAVLMFLYR